MALHNVVRAIHRVGVRSVFALSFALASISFSRKAQAVTPVPEGTFMVAAERITGLSLTFPSGGDAYFSMGLLQGQPAPMQFPRVGADYFIIDGLSLGGNVGLAFNGGSDETVLLIAPRVGYAFALSERFDFWPRLGVGFLGAFRPGDDYTSGLITLEGMFVWKVNRVVGVEFGPTFDALLASGSEVILGGNAGLVARF